MRVFLSIKVLEGTKAKNTTFKENTFGGVQKPLSAGFLLCLLSCEATAPQGSAADCF